MMQLVCVWDMMKGRERRPQIILHEVSESNILHTEAIFQRNSTFSAFQ